MRIFVFLLFILSFGLKAQGPPPPPPEVTWSFDGSSISFAQPTDGADFLDGKTYNDTPFLYNIPLRIFQLDSATNYEVGLTLSCTVEQVAESGVPTVLASPVSCASLGMSFTYDNGFSNNTGMGFGFYATTLTFNTNQFPAPGVKYKFNLGASNTTSATASVDIVTENIRISNLIYDDWKDAVGGNVIYNISVEEGSSQTIFYETTDSGASTLGTRTYSIAGDNPSFMNFNTSTGQLDINPQAGDAGVYNFSGTYTSTNPNDWISGANSTRGNSFLQA